MYEYKSESTLQRQDTDTDNAYRKREKDTRTIKSFHKSSSIASENTF